MRRNFVQDLNDAGEAWFAYADQHFGESVLVPSTRYPGKQEWTRPRYEAGENGRSHGAFLDGYLFALGWRKRDNLEYYWPETESAYARGVGGL